MELLLYALAAPVIGVLLYPVLHDNPRLTKTFDRSMYVVVPLLILTQVLGHQVEHNGWAPGGILVLLGVMVLGLLIPIGIEHISHNIAPKTEALSVIFGFLGLGLHALLEGSSLNTDSSTIIIPLAVHRLAVGLMVWWILYPRYGLPIAIIGIAGLLSTTLAGFFLADILPHGFTGSDLFQAFVAGSLLHVVFHEHHHGSPHAHDH